MDIIHYILWIYCVQVPKRPALLDENNDNTEFVEDCDHEQNNESTSPINDTSQEKKCQIEELPAENNESVGTVVLNCSKEKGNANYLKMTF